MERKHTSGKRGRAASIEEEQVAPTLEAIEESEVEDKGAGEDVDVDTGVDVDAEWMVASPANVEEIVSPETHVDNVTTNANVIDLYEVGHKTVTRTMCEDPETEVPFAHQIKLHGPQGEIV